MDDLSFEEFEIEYKYLKAVIEGGLEKKPDNVLIYATSNRRHLVRETFSDRTQQEDDLHNNDTVQEKLSLVARFGVSIYFGAPTPKEFKNIVKVLAEKQHVTMSEEELLAEASKWELSMADFPAGRRSSSSTICSDSRERTLKVGAVQRGWKYEYYDICSNLYRIL